MQENPVNLATFSQKMNLTSTVCSQVGNSW